MIRYAMFGRKGTGKDYHANAFCHKQGSVTPTLFRVMKFARPVHDLCYMLDPEYDKRIAKYRRLAQLVGTEVGRGDVNVSALDEAFRHELADLRSRILLEATKKIPYLSLIDFNRMLGTSNLWVDLFEAMYRNDLSLDLNEKGQVVYAVTDVRFSNEFECLRRLGFHFGFIASPEEEVNKTTAKEQTSFTEKHVSEFVATQFYQHLVIDQKKLSELPSDLGIHPDFLIWNDRGSGAPKPTDEFLTMEESYEKLSTYNY